MNSITRSTFTFLVLIGSLLSFSSCDEILEEIYKGQKGDSTKTIVEIAQETGELSILVEALERAELVEALSAEGPFTVFAPDNHAFETLFKTLGVSSVDAIDKALLTDVLRYHVIAARALAADLQDGQELETLLGENVAIDIQGKKVFVNDVQVKSADIMASNGVIHIIEEVLLPPTTGGEATVRFEENDDFGAILVDAQGRSLYVFTPDVKGESVCVDGCSERWPVFYTEDLIVGEGLDTDDFGTIDRPDGSQQTTYKGWPLYLFQNDAEPGDVEGDGVGDVWFVAKDYSVFLGSQEIDGEATTYLVDENGQTLYYFAVDTFGESNCTEGCLDVWPPFSREDVVAPSSLAQSDFSILTTEGGERISTYRNRPLLLLCQRRAGKRSHQWAGSQRRLVCGISRYRPPHAAIHCRNRSRE